MFEKFKTKAAGFGQKMLVKMGQAEEFKEDEDFTHRIEVFKATREAFKDLADKAQAMIKAQELAIQAKLTYVCVFFTLLGSFYRLILITNQLEALSNVGGNEGVDERVSKYGLEQYVLTSLIIFGFAFPSSPIQLIFFQLAKALIEYENYNKDAMFVLVLTSLEHSFFSYFSAFSQQTNHFGCCCSSNRIS